jgi:aryl-alcohol dehydrogenase-like predicted oxidoreductase
MAAFERTRPVETLQPPYHLFRRSVEKSIWPYVGTRDIGVLVYSPLASGLLTGAMTEDTTFDEGDWRSQASAFTGENFRTNLAVVEELKKFAASKDCEVSQLAIAWVLAQPEVDVAIVGARSHRNIERSLAAVDIELDAADLAEIDHITMDGVEIEGATPEGAV